MTQGVSYGCSITMKNSGCQWLCWPAGSMLTVGQFNGPAACKLIPYPFYGIYTNPCIVEVTENCTFPFTIDVPADAPPGIYEITWQMKDNNHWFGEFRDEQIYHKNVTVVAPIPPTITAAGSRKTHGSAGTFEIALSASNEVECRENGPTLVTVTFDKAVQAIGGPSNDDVSLSSGTVTGLAIAGNTLEVQLTGAPQAGKLTMAFPGITDSANLLAVVTETLCIESLVGDASNDSVTNIFDLIAVRNVLNQAVNAASFRHDITADGNINIFDLIAIRNRLNLTVAACP